MEKKKPNITVQDLYPNVNEEKIRRIEETLDCYLERLFQGSDSRASAEFRAFIDSRPEGKTKDKLWLLDHWKDHWRNYYKMAKEKNRALNCNKRV
ncbi:hypothetical protein MYX82_04275 [Acidobacteria bacterium AH-259-D05]|nr:hypothetical protein [Acidobacteria bacterium AH-259-D05]